MIRSGVGPGPISYARIGKRCDDVTLGQSHRTLREIVADEIRTMIMAGELAPGERLYQDRLAEVVPRRGAHVCRLAATLARDTLRASSWHRGFHRVVEVAAGNPHLETVVSPLRNQTQMVFTRSTTRPMHSVSNGVERRLAGETKES